MSTKVTLLERQRPVPKTRRRLCYPHLRGLVLDTMKQGQKPQSGPAGRACASLVTLPLGVGHLQTGSPLGEFSLGVAG